MPVDHARRQGVRRPVVFDDKQERRPTAAGFGVHDPNDRVCIVEKLDLVLHLCRLAVAQPYAAPPPLTSQLFSKVAMRQFAARAPGKAHPDEIGRTPFSTASCTTPIASS